MEGGQIILGNGTQFVLDILLLIKDFPRSKIFAREQILETLQK